MDKKDSHQSNNALHISHLTVNYDNYSVLWDVSLKVPKGTLIAIVGPNGAGKSTLIKASLGLLKPLSGKIEFFGQPLSKVRQRVAYVPQRESVDWDFPITVKELVLMGRYGTLGLLQQPREADRAAAEHYLNVVGMSSFGERQINQLSGGQQQRVFIARALLQEADIYFMDEPFSGIDQTTELLLIDLLKQLRDKGKTVFVVHHDLNTVERYFDWCILLNKRLVACGEMKEVFNAETLNSTYGKSYALLDEALKLSGQKKTGL